MKRTRGEGSKLFKVLVLGGLSMAVPACSNGTTSGDDSGTSDAAGPNDAAPADASAQDAGCAPADMIKCPDCTHGLCGW